MVGVNVDDDFVFFIVKEGVFFILIDVDILDFLLNVGSVFVFLWLLEIVFMENKFVFLKKEKSSLSEEVDF